METAKRRRHRRNAGIMLIFGDLLILLALMLCAVLLIRTPSASADGIVPSDPAAQSLAAPPAVQQDPYTLMQPTADAAADAPRTLPVMAPDAPATEPAVMEQAPAPAVEAAPAPVGDFSAVFPATDTGANAFRSYQSEDKRIAITKVSENGVTYFVADVWIKNIQSFQTAFAKDEYGRNIHEMPAKVASDHGAVFAVSGDYYGARDKGVVVRNGRLYRDVANTDVCILKTDGTLAAYGAKEFSALQSLDETVWQAWSFGPALVKDGAACDTSSSKIKVRNPRCAIGFYEPGHYCFLVVDGRQDGYSTGMTLNELSAAFVSLGCQTAYNLDGGATAIMVFDGKVVNRPTNGGRASSDIICF